MPQGIALLFLITDFLLPLQLGQYHLPLGFEVTPTHLKWNHSIIQDLLSQPTMSSLPHTFLHRQYMVSESSFSSSSPSDFCSWSFVVGCSCFIILGPHSMISGFSFCFKKSRNFWYFLCLYERLRLHLLHTKWLFLCAASKCLLTLDLCFDT